MSGPSGRCMFNSLRSCQTIVQSGLYYFTFPPAVCESSSSSPSLPTLDMVSVAIFTIPTGLSKHFIVALICISLVTNVEKLTASFFCHKYIYFVNCLFKSLASFLFLNCVGCFLRIESWKFFVYIGYKSFNRYMICPCFSPSVWLSLSFF